MKRINVKTWDETFMSIAHVIKERSKDPSTQVGACIVSSDNRILSIGYNGAPNGFDDDKFPWGRESDRLLDTKYPFVVHAERNAVLNFRGNLRELQGSRVFVTLFPCNECSKELAQIGVKEVIFEKEPILKDDLYFASKRILEECGIKTSQF